MRRLPAGAEARTLCRQDLLPELLLELLPELLPKLLLELVLELMLVLRRAEGAAVAEFAARAKVSLSMIRVRLKMCNEGTIGSNVQAEVGLGRF